MRCNAIRVVGLLASVATAIILVGWVCAGEEGLRLGVLAALGVAGVGIARSDTMVLRALRARPVSEIECPTLYRIVRELATEARRPMPSIYLAPADTPNALATGRTPRRAVVCVTRGLLRTVNERELRGVIAHELSHVHNRDTLVSSLTAAIATLAVWLTSLAWLLPLGDSEDEDVPALLGALLFLVVGPVAAGVVHMGTARGREYRADAYAAQLTGDPLGLASALRKIEVGTRTHPMAPERGLLAVSHLMIAYPFPERGTNRLFATHPPTTERIRRLERLAGYRR